MYNKSMATVTFDTLKFVECLKEHDFTEEQAKGLSEAFKEAQNSSIQDLATKGDVRELKHEMKELETSLKLEMTNTKADILKWIAGMLVAQAAIVATLVKLL